MKKAIFYLPAVLGLAIYGILGIVSGFNVISPFVWTNIALLFISALILHMEKWYGCIGGLIVGGSLIYMSTQYTGQVIDIERPLGFVLGTYYLICGIVIYKKKY